MSMTTITYRDFEFELVAQPGVVYYVERGLERHNFLIAAVRDNRHKLQYQRVLEQAEKWLGEQPRRVFTVEQRDVGQFLPRGAVVLGVLTGVGTWVPADEENLPLPLLPHESTTYGLDLNVTLSDPDQNLLESYVARDVPAWVVAEDSFARFRQQVPGALGSIARSIRWDARDLGWTVQKSRRSLPVEESFAGIFLDYYNHHHSG